MKQLYEINDCFHLTFHIHLIIAPALGTLEAMVQSGVSGDIRTIVRQTLNCKKQLATFFLTFMR